MEYTLNMTQILDDLGLDDTINLYNELQANSNCDCDFIFREYELEEFWSIDIYNFITRHMPCSTEYFTFDVYDHIKFMNSWTVRDFLVENCYHDSTVVEETLINYGLNYKDYLL